MLQLPPELWLQVASHVPDTELFKLYSINNTFFQAALDRAYREVRLNDRCPAALIHKLACLENPLAGPRVKSLYICPTSIAGAQIATLDGLGGFEGVVRSIPAAWFTPPASTPKDVFPRQMLLTLSKLTSVEEFTIEWSSTVHDFHCSPILSSICTLFSRNLLVLTLSMSFGVMLNVLDGMTGLENLRELSLEFTYIADGMSGIALPADESDALTQLALRINGFSATLRSFAITSAGHLDFSPFFESLGRFPYLSKVTLFLPFDPLHLLSAGAFNFFLRRHSSIRRLVLAPQYCCGLSREFVLTAANEWLADCFDGVLFPFLQEFELGLNILGYGETRLPTTLSYVGAIVQKLDSLHITGRIVTYNDLKLIISAFLRNGHGTSPRSLSFEILILEPTLIDILARQLPNLEFLDITYRWISSSDCSGKMCFSAEMEGRTYPGWKLRKIVLRPICERDREGLACKASIVRCVPALSV